MSENVIANAGTDLPPLCLRLADHAAMFLVKSSWAESLTTPRALCWIRLALSAYMGKRKHEDSIDITGSGQPSSSSPKHDVINLADDTPTPPGTATKLAYI